MASRKAAARSGMTSSKDLGEITLSTFRGEDGPLVKEVNKVLTWFKEQGSPDILFLSTIMLAGIGKVLKRELNIPVYGFLQGEDSFLDSLLPEYRVEAWKLLSRDVSLLDGCIAPSKYFGDLMAERLSLKPSKIKHHPNGITTEGIYLPKMHLHLHHWGTLPGYAHSRDWTYSWMHLLSSRTQVITIIFL